MYHEPMKNVGMFDHKEDLLLIDEKHSRLCSTGNIESEILEILSSNGDSYTVPLHLAKHASLLFKLLYRERNTEKSLSWLENRKCQFKCPFTSDILSIIVEFIKSGQVEFDVFLLLKVISASSYFQIEPLYHIAWEAAEARLSVYNALIMYEAARAFNFVRVLESSWRLLGLYDIKELIFETDDFFSLGLNSLVHLLENRTNLKICCEDYIVSKLVAYFDRNSSLSIERLFRILLTPSIINFNSVSHKFWQSMSKSSSEKYHKFALLALELKEKISCFVNDSDVLSLTFNGNKFDCATCQRPAIFSVEIPGYICCEACWREYVQPYMIDLSMFTISKIQINDEADSISGFRLDSKSQVDLSRRTTFVSVASSDRPSQKSGNIKTRIGSLFTQTKADDKDTFLFNISNLDSVSRIYQSQSAIRLGSSKMNYSQKLRRTLFSSGRYMLHTMREFKWTSSVVDIHVGTDLTLAGIGEDENGAFSIQGSCETNIFEFNKSTAKQNLHYCVNDESQLNGHPRFTGFWQLSSKNSTVNILAGISNGYFELIPIDDFPNFNKSEDLFATILENLQEHKMRFESEIDCFTLSTNEHKNKLISTLNITNSSIYQELDTYKYGGFISCSICSRVLEENNDSNKLFRTHNDEYHLICNKCSIMPQLTVFNDANAVVTGYFFENGIKIVLEERVLYLVFRSNDVTCLLLQNKKLQVLHKVHLYVDMDPSSMNKSLYTSDQPQQLQKIRTANENRCNECLNTSISCTNALNYLSIYNISGSTEISALIQDFVVHNYETLLRGYKDRSLVCELFQASTASARHILTKLSTIRGGNDLIATNLEQYLDTIMYHLLNTKDALLDIQQLCFVCGVLFSGCDHSLIWNLLSLQTQNKVKDGLLEVIVNPKYKLSKETLHKLGRLVASIITVLGESDWPELTSFLQNSKINSTKLTRILSVFFGSLAETMMEELECEDLLRKHMCDTIVQHTITLKRIDLLHTDGNIILTKVAKSLSRYLNTDLKLKMVDHDFTITGAIIASFGWKINSNDFKGVLAESFTPALAAMFKFTFYICATEKTTVANASFFHSLIHIITLLLTNREEHRLFDHILGKICLPHLSLIVGSKRILSYQFKELANSYQSLLSQCFVLDIVKPNDLKRYILYIIESIQQNISNYGDGTTYFSMLYWTTIISDFFESAAGDVSWITDTSWMQEQFEDISSHQSSFLMMLICFSSIYHIVADNYHVKQKYKVRMSKLCVKLVTNSIPISFLKRGHRYHTRVVFDEDPDVSTKRKVKALFQQETSQLSKRIIRDSSYLLMFEMILFPLVKYFEGPFQYSEENFETSVRLNLFSRLLDYHPLDTLGIVNDGKISILVLFIFQKIVDSIGHLQSHILLRSILKLLVSFSSRLEQDSRSPEFEELYAELNRQSQMYTEVLINRLISVVSAAIPNYSPEICLEEFKLICSALSNIAEVASESWFISFRITAETFFAEYIATFKGRAMTGFLLLECLPTFYECYQEICKKLDTSISMPEIASTIELILELVSSLIRNESYLLRLSLTKQNPLVDNAQVKKAPHIKHPTTNFNPEWCEDQGMLLTLIKGVLLESIDFLLFLFNETPGTFASKSHLFDTMFNELLLVDTKVAQKLYELFSLLCNKSCFNSSQSNSLLLSIFSFIDISKRSFSLDMSLFELMKNLMSTKFYALQDHHTVLKRSLQLFISKTSIYFKPTYVIKDESSYKYHKNILSLCNIFLHRFPIAGKFTFMLKYLKKLIRHYYINQDTKQKRTTNYSLNSNNPNEEEKIEDSLAKEIHSVLDKLQNHGIKRKTVLSLRQDLPEIKKEEKIDNVFANLFRC